MCVEILVEHCASMRITLGLIVACYVICTTKMRQVYVPTVFRPLGWWVAAGRDSGVMEKI